MTHAPRPPSPADLLGRILAAAGLSTPDGRRLVHYPIDDATHAEILSALEPLLAGLRTDDDVRRLVQRPAHRHVPALFCLHAAEAWRKHYDGSHWAWRHIPLASGLPPEARSELVLRGLRSLSRHVLRLERREYLGTIAAECGLPPALLQRDGTALRAFFRALLADLSRFRDVPPAELARSHADHLPARLTDPDYLALLAEVASAAVALSDALARAGHEPPVTPALLSRLDADWRARFPLRLEDDAAIALVSGLVQDAAVAATDSAVPRILTRLEVTPTELRLVRALELPARLTDPALRDAFALPADALLPSRLDLLHETPRGPRLLAELVRRGDAFAVEDRRSPTLSDEILARRSPALSVLPLQHLADIARVPRVLARGGGQTFGPLDPAAPTLGFDAVATFEAPAGTTADTAPSGALPLGAWRLMGEGSVAISRDRDGLAIVPWPADSIRVEPASAQPRPSPAPSELSLVHIPTNLLETTLHRVDQSGDVAESISVRRSLRASPKFLQLRAPELRAADRTVVFLAAPLSQLTDDDPRPARLECRTSDDTWVAADTVRYPTSCPARLVRGDAVEARLRLRLLPTRHAALPRVEPIGTSACRVTLALPADTRAGLDAPGLALSRPASPDGSTLILEIRAASDTPPPTFTLLLASPADDLPPLPLTLRFPRADAGFRLDDGTRLPRGTRLPLERLSELVAEAWRPPSRASDDDNTIALRVSISAQDIDDAVQPVRVATLPADGSSGLHTCHLVTIERHLRALMAFSTAQDAELRVELMVPTNPEDRRHPRVFLTRFDGGLRVDRDGPKACIQDASGTHADAIDVASISPHAPSVMTPWDRKEDVWMPGAPLPPGPSLVIGRDRVTGAVPMRPGLTVQPAFDDDGPPASDLAHAISRHQYLARKAAMREALARLHSDPGGVGWPIVEGTIATLSTLPSATFEVIRNLVAVPRALAYALMHTAHPERLIDALRELPFAPSAFPVAALQDAARDAFMELSGQLQAMQVSEPMAMALAAVGARGRDVAMRLAGLAPELGPLLAAALNTPELSAPTAASPEEVLLAFRRRTPEASQPPALPEIASRFEVLVDTRPYAPLARPIRTSPEVLRDIAAAPIVAASLALRRDIPNEGLDKALLLQLWTARTFDPDYFVDMHIATAHHVGRHSNGKETP